MDPILNHSTPARERAATVQRLRRQVSTGAYAPPVDLLVERLVELLTDRPSPRPAQPSRRNGCV